MAQHLIAAIDEAGAEKLVSKVVTSLSGKVTPGSMYGFKYNLSWNFVPGDFELVDAGDIIRFREWDIHINISFSWSIDLDDILPNICIPEICGTIPLVGTVCTPSWCNDWPAITVSVPLPTLVSEVSIDFSLKVEHDIPAAQWVIIGSVNPFTLDIDLVDSADMAEELFKDTVKDKLSAIPDIGQFIGYAIAWIMSDVLDSVDDLLEFLNTALSDSLKLHPILGVGFELHRVDELFRIVPAVGAEPAVIVRIIDLDAEITADEELVASADIALP
jgi:hypothetical protein